MKRVLFALEVIGVILFIVSCKGYRLDGPIRHQQNFNNPQNPRLVVQPGHVVWGNSVIFSPDGQSLAIFGGSADRTIRLWDIRTGRGLLTLKQKYVVSSVAFSPDGQLFACQDGYPTIKLWDIRTGKLFRTFPGHSFAFSPDGQFLASADRTIRLWNIHTGRELFTLTGHKSGVNSLVFSPDGQLLVSGSADRTIRLWNVRTGRELLTLTGHKTGVYSVSFSPDGQLLASRDGPPIIRLWDVKTGEQLRSFKGDSGAFSPDGRFFASSNSSTTNLWDVRTGKLLHTLTGRSVVFSPDGQFLASSGSSTIRLWDIRTGKLLHTFIGRSVTFSPDGQFFVICDGLNIKFWDMNNGKELVSLIAINKRDWAVVTPNGLFDASPGAMQWMHWVVDLKPIEFNQLRDRYYEPGLLSKLLGFRDEPLRKVSPLTDSKMYPDIEFLATDSLDPIIRLRLTNRGGGIGRVVIFLNGKEIIADARDKNADPQAQQMELIIDLPRYAVFLPDEQNTLEVKAYNAEGSLSSLGIRRTYEPLSILPDAQEPELVVQTGHSGRVNSVAFSPDGQLVASGSDEHSIRLWDVRTGKLLRTLTGHADRVYSVVFSPDGQLLASGSKDTTVKLWDVRTGRELLTLTGHSVRYCEGFWLYSVAFSPEGQILASSDDQAIRLWDVQTGKLLRTFPEGSHSITFSPDGQIIASDSGKLWDIHTGKILRTLTGNLPWGGYFVAFIPNGQFLAGGSLDGSLGLWDVQTGTMFRTLTKHSGSLYSVAFSPDGQFLAGSSEDQTIRLWNVRTGTILRTFTGHSGEVYSVTFSPDGQILASGSTDTTVKLWDVHTGKLLRTLTGYSRQVYSVAFSSDRQILASSEDYSIRLWDIHTGKLLRTLTDHSGRIYSVAFSPDGKFLVGGSSDRILRLWDVWTGTVVHSFIGHSDNVGSVAFSPDGQFIASGSDDHTIRLWDARSGTIMHTLTGHSDTIRSVAFSPDGRLLASASLDGSFKLWDVRNAMELAAFAAIDRTDYIIATPDQYYTAVKEGLKGIAFRVGNNVFPFEQFDLRLNRPDIVLQNLGYAPRELIETYHNVYQKRLRRMNFTEEMLGDDFHLPEIEILTKDVPLAMVNKYFTFTIRAADSKYLLDRIHVYVNNVPIYGIRGINLRDKHTFEHEQDIMLELSNGRNKIQVSVLNQQGTESLKETVEVEYTGTPVPSELYVVAVGVSEYTEANRNLKYAAKDASDLVSFFQQHRQNFGNIYVTTILDTDATKENILAVKKFLQQTKVDDQIILFFAGHGLLDEQFDYYFATTDVDFEYPSERGVSYEAIEGLLDGIPARKKLLLMDTCHSGEIDKEEVQPVATPDIQVEEKGVTGRSFRGLKRLREKSLGLQNSYELLRELFANLQRGSGAIVISAASGLEFAYEAGRYQNGLFTHALLEGVQGQADANADQVIQVSELRDYVTAKVRKLTHNRQTPTVRRENLEFDFQVAYTTQGNDIHREGQATEPIPDESLTGEELSAADRDDANTLFTGTFKYVQDVNNRNVVHILKLVQTDQIIKGNLELTLDDSYYRCCQTTATSSITGKANGTSATITFSGGYTSCPCGVGKAWGDEDSDYDSISYSISSGYTVTYTLENDGEILREHCDTIKGCPRRCTIELAGVPQRQYCHRLCPWDYIRQQ